MKTINDKKKDYEEDGTAADLGAVPEEPLDVVTIDKEIEQLIQKARKK